MIIGVLLLGFINLCGLDYVVLRLQYHQVPDLDGTLRDEFARNRREFAEANKDLRQEVTGGITQTRDTLDKRLENLRDKNDEKLEQIRRTVEGRLETLQKDNAEKLEKMRQTVDEKLQGTLEKRLTESFKQIDVRLEQVYK